MCEKIYFGSHWLSDNFYVAYLRFAMIWIFHEWKFGKSYNLIVAEFSWFCDADAWLTSWGRIISLDIYESIHRILWWFWLIDSLLRAFYHEAACWNFFLLNSCSELSILGIWLKISINIFRSTHKSLYINVLHDNAVINRRWAHLLSASLNIPS